MKKINSRKFLIQSVKLFTEIQRRTHSVDNDKKRTKRYSTWNVTSKLKCWFKEIVPHERTMGFSGAAVERD